MPQSQGNKDEDSGSSLWVAACRGQLAALWRLRGRVQEYPGYARMGFVGNIGGLVGGRTESRPRWPPKRSRPGVDEFCGLPRLAGGRPRVRESLRKCLRPPRADSRDQRNGFGGNESSYARACGQLKKSLFPHPFLRFGGFRER